MLELHFLALCVWSLHAAIVIFDNEGMIMDNAAAQAGRAVAHKNVWCECACPIFWPEAAHRHIQRHLHCWQRLASYSQKQGWLLWRFKPKHHYLDHVSWDLPGTRLNPNMGSVWDEESFLGKIKKIAVRCHSATTMKRLIQRYLLLMGMRFEDARRMSRSFRN